jgi:hypothetical protein
VVALGNQWRAPNVAEVLSILEDPKVNLSINLLGIDLLDRPAFFAQLMPSLQAMRARTGRPHWLVLDEAHHMLPPTWGPAGSTLPLRLGETILITVHPDHVNPLILESIDIAVAIGRSPGETLAKFADTAGRSLARPGDVSYDPDRVIAWFLRKGEAPFPMEAKQGRVERIRHHRKYAEGNLRVHSFYFRGPGNQHNIKAHNLAIFCQIAEGIDEATWMFHLRRGDYSRWFRHTIKDDHLATETERIERRGDLGAADTRALVRELVGARYTLPP